MASTPHDAARRLVRRYLDPRRSWGAAEDRAMREHLRACDACAGVYRQAVAAHREAVGGDQQAPTGFEQRRMRDAAVQGALAAAAPRAGARRWPAWALGALAAVAALALAVMRPAEPAAPAPSDEAALAARGPARPGEPLVGIGVSGVTADGSEYEVVAGDGARAGDWLRVYWTNERPELGHLFVLALQAGRPLAWLAPLPPDEAESLPIGTGRAVSLPFESRVTARLAPGPVTLVALFTARPLTVTEVAAALADRALDPELAAVAPSDLEVEVAARLRLGPGDVTQLLETRVLPGSGEETRVLPGSGAETRVLPGSGEETRVLPGSGEEAPDAGP